MKRWPISEEVGRLTFPRSTLGRIILAALALWLVMSAVALVLWNAGDSTPGEGRGTPVEAR